MILVLTTAAGDYSHIGIVDWLRHLGANYMILSGEAIIEGRRELFIDNGSIFVDGVNLTQEVTCVYYRRWLSPFNRVASEDNGLQAGLNRNLSLEMHEVKEFLYNNLSSAVWFPNPYSIAVNKLTALEKARTVGLDVPQYIVTSSKKELIRFYNAHDKRIITKAIGNFLPVTTDDRHFIFPTYTKRVSYEQIDKLPETFCPSLIQQMIDKEFEYRIVYFDSAVYPVALLSQESDVTQLDSRRTDGNVQSRLVPTRIASSLHERIVAFMNSMNLNIGSIDFIHSKDGRDYFLEVNPVGQIGGYSVRSGFNVEKDIAQRLIYIDKNGQH